MIGYCPLAEHSHAGVKTRLGDDLLNMPCICYVGIKNRRSGDGRVEMNIEAYYYFYISPPMDDAKGDEYPTSN